MSVQRPSRIQLRSARVTFREIEVVTRPGGKCALSGTLLHFVWIDLAVGADRKAVSLLGHLYRGACSLLPLVGSPPHRHASPWNYRFGPIEPLLLVVIPHPNGTRDLVGRSLRRNWDRHGLINGNPFPSMPYDSKVECSGRRGEEGRPGRDTPPPSQRLGPEHARCRWNDALDVGGPEGS